MFQLVGTVSNFRADTLWVFSMFIHYVVARSSANNIQCRLTIVLDWERTPNNEHRPTSEVFKATSGCFLVSILQFYVLFGVWFIQCNTPSLVCWQHVSERASSTSPRSQTRSSTSEPHSGVVTQNSLGVTSPSPSDVSHQSGHDVQEKTNTNICSPFLNLPDLNRGKMLIFTHNLAENFVSLLI